MTGFIIINGVFIEMKNIFNKYSYNTYVMMCAASSVNNTVQSDITVNGTSFEDIQHNIDSSNINDMILIKDNYKSTGSPITISKSLKFQCENNATLYGRKV